MEAERIKKRILATHVTSLLRKRKMRSRLHLIISGCVQGVSFRAWVVRQAENLKLVGWVKNRDDGSVEILAEGVKNNLLKFIVLCRRGSPAAVVDGIALHWGKTKIAFTGFEIKF